MATANYSVVFPSGVTGSFQRNGSSSFKNKTGSIVKKYLVALHVIGLPRRDFKVTAFQDEAPIEEDTLRDIAYMFVDMINLSTTLPSPADIAAAVLAPEKLATYTAQLQRGVTPESGLGMEKRLRTFLMDSASLLFPTAPWCDPATTSSRKPWEFVLSQDFAEETALEWGDGDGGNVTTADGAPQPYKRRRRSANYPSSSLHAESGPVLPPWFTHTQIVPVGFVATLTAFLLPEFQQDLGSILEHVSSLGQARPFGADSAPLDAANALLAVDQTRVPSVVGV